MSDAASTNPDLVIGRDGKARPLWATSSQILQEYYDTEWGVPISDEHGVYERLCLEAFQSGLSWSTILNKREGFRRAFCQFDPDIVATFDNNKVAELMLNTQIVRNRKKIEAAIINARATIALRAHGGLADFVWSYAPAAALAPHRLAEIPTKSPESAALAKALRSAGFKFVGPTTMFALMEAIGMVNTHLIGSHRREQMK